jgi:DNA-binding SARP family transcriptional activator/predicted ATPase
VDATLRIDLLGDFRLTYGGERVDAVNTTRLQSLLAYLALRRGYAQSRQHLAFSFWPDSREKQALSNLRTLLYHLRQALPDPDRFLDVDAKTLTWRAGAACVLDIAEFEAAQHEADDAFQQGDLRAARAALERAVAYYRGDLLPGCYEDWVLPERERLHQQGVRALERLIRLLEDERDYAEAILRAEHLLRHDPLREPSYRLLMRLHALQGDRASVVRTFQACAEVLERELDLEPEPTTHTLYEQLVGDGAVPPVPEPPDHDLIQGRNDLASGMLPLVGRRQEWELLRQAWHRAAEGQAHLLTICGEAGIGKTRLAEELLAWAARQGIATAQARSYAAEGRLAYAPITEWLRMDVLHAGLSHLHDVWLSEVARLLPELRVDHPDLPETPPLAENWQRQRLFEALARAILGIGRPLLLLLDDLQWCDQETLEWVRYLLHFAPQARLLIVGTFRTEEVDADHPLRTLLLDLGRSGQRTEVALEPLVVDEAAELAAHVAERTLSDEEVTLLYRETEGNPLFVVESVRAGLPSAASAPETLEIGRTALSLATPEQPLPPTVHSVITKRLAQLSPEARAAVSVAAAVGRAFSLEVLLQTGYADDARMADALDELWQRRILRETEPGVYDFTHDKLREVAYADLSPARRQLLHRRIAHALTDIHAASLDDVSAQVAVHYEQGRCYEDAISYYQRAAQVALRVYADEEVARLLRRALGLLMKLPETQARDRQELELLTALGSALIATRGWAHPDVGATYERAHALCRQLGDEEHLFTYLWGLWTFRLVRAELQELQELTDVFQRMAEAQPSSNLIVAAHLAGFFNAFFLGDPVAALEHMEGAFAQPEFEEKPIHVFPMSADERVFCHCCAAHVLWVLGFPDQALERITEALTLAAASGRPFEETIARCYAAMLHQYRQEPDAVEAQAKRAAVLCAEHGFAYYGAWCSLMEGWALAKRGAPDEGISRMHQGLSRLKDTGAVLREPYYLALLAEAHAQVGGIKEGLALLAEALAVIERRGEHWIEAEVRRLRGDLLLAEGSEDAAEHCYAEAMGCASRQNARSLELRVAMSRGRLWHRQGRTAAAREHLQNVYARFTEGHDTPNLLEATALLTAWA